ncbi:MAG: GIY-YIG nuclease family protein [Thermoanaerobaculia bacterium]|nr:GIY-YIG nuclease family protein [Thermoanaerobaculia bacterium]
MHLFFVYIMSNRAHRLYVGMTGNLPRRTFEHREKLFENAFTAKYNFYKLVYFETHDTYAVAIAREKALKGWKRDRKVALIQEKNPHWKDLSKSWHEALAAR